MKNLKQVLALGMAFSLSMSTMASAAFTDSADIKAGEAVNMLSALGVIKGYEDGSFKPEATVTRAEAAKMIFTIRNGGNDNASAWAGTPTSFTDLSGYGWAEGYIKYCQSMGIIAGKSATSFDPGAKVTGTELAKMVLVTMGYNAETAGLVGSTWANKTLGLAGENGLLGDVDANLAAGLPRQYAAQLLYNGLNADVVVYENGQYQKVETTKTEWVENPNKKGEYQAIQVTTNKTLGNAYMSLSTEEVVLKSISYDKAKKTFTLKTTGGEFTKVTEDYSELIGQKVNVLHKKDKNDEVYGVYANEDSTSVSAVAGKVDLVSGKDAVKIDGTEYKLQKAASQTPVYYINSDTEVDKLDTVLGNTKYDAYQLKLVDNEGNDKFDEAYITPVDVAKVTYVGTKSVSAGGKSYNFDDCNIYEGIAKDDYVVITADKYSVYGETTLVKADKVTGKVTGSKTDEIAIDGTWYKTASTYTGSKNIGDTCDFVVVNGYVFFSDVTKETNRNVLFVSAFDDVEPSFGSKTAIVEAKVLINSEEKVVKIERVDGKLIADKAANTENGKYYDGSQLNKASMYTYTVNSNGNYEIKPLDSTNKAGYDSYVTDYKFDNASDKLKNNSGDTITIPDDAVVYVQKKSGTTISGLDCITGKDLKKSSTDFGNQIAQALVSETDGIKYAKVIALEDDTNSAPGATYDTKYGYVADANGGVYLSQNDAGDQVTYMTIWNGTDSLHVYVKGDQTKNIKVGQVVSYELVSDKEVEDVVDVTGSAVAITGIERKSEGTIVLQTGNKTSETYKLDEDVTIVAIDSDNKTNGDKITVDAIGTAQSKTEGKYLTNAYVVVKDKKVVAIFWDINNDLGTEYEK